jgi:phenylpropionate dioxygenase-like ring-hydroxylating dioxygenase large terminal subunit
MPSEPAESNFKDKVRIPAYPTYEAGGLVYCYMGPPEKKPAPPLFAWNQQPAERRAMSKIWQQCNWLQALEGGIDTVHSNFLHGGRPPGVRYSENDPRGRANNVSKAPHLEVVPTDYGYVYAGIRDMGAEGTNHVRGYHWIMPWNQLRGYVRNDNVNNAGHMWVPMDDENTTVYNWSVNFFDNADVPARPEGQQMARGGGIEGDVMGVVAGRINDGPDAPIWFRDAKRNIGAGNEFVVDIDMENNYRSVRNMDNKYMIDRYLQKTQTYSGITGTNTQDRAIQESMGAIADRTLERLGTTDRAIIHARRSLLQAIKMVQDGGDPPGVAPTYYTARAFETVLPKDVHWWEAMKPMFYPEPEKTPVAR